MDLPEWEETPKVKKKSPRSEDPEGAKDN